MMLAKEPYLPPRTDTLVNWLVIFVLSLFLEDKIMEIKLNTLCFIPTHNSSSTLKGSHYPGLDVTPFRLCFHTFT